MIGALLVLIAAAEVALLTLVIAMRRRQPDRALTLLILVILALIWDNTVIAIGSTAGEGETLRTLSIPRHVTHGLLVPLLIMVGVGLGRRARHPGPRRPDRARDARRPDRRADRRRDPLRHRRPRPAAHPPRRHPAIHQHRLARRTDPGRGDRS
jgi:hypothetical protein